MRPHITGIKCIFFYTVKSHVSPMDIPIDGYQSGLRAGDILNCWGCPKKNHVGQTFLLSFFDNIGQARMPIPPINVIFRQPHYSQASPKESFGPAMRNIRRHPQRGTRGGTQMNAPEDPEREISRYREGPDLLEQAVIGLRDCQLDARPAGGGWSVREIVHHIADGDDIWKMGIKMAIVTNRQSLTWVVLIVASGDLEWSVGV